MKRMVQILLVVLLGFGLSGCFFAYRAPVDDGATPVVDRQPRGLPGYPEKIWTDAPDDNGQAMPLASDTFVKLAGRANPAVVNIFTETNIRTRVGDPLGLFTIRTPNLDFNANALGTGFLISPDGFLLTNAHVVASADEVKVYLWNESEVKTAQVVGIDRVSDLALLKISHSKPLPFLQLADSDSVEVGEMAVAIGNPFGLNHSLTDGLISAKHRRLHEGKAGQYEDFLQTSAQINPGNSGGPLLDLHGAVVGVNTAIIAGGQGIGFAVPSNLAKEVVPHLLSYGRVRASYIGIEVGEVTPDLAKRMELSEARGGVVTDVIAAGPAERAGLAKNDIILAVNKTQVHDAAALARTVSLLIADRPAVLTVLRGGKQIKITLTPIMAPADRETGRK
ncbi:MAG: trypsin-like serine protease [Myxococcales bacterium]|nr:trypsin-like serine protease [Myxococcales bacterium]